MLGQLFIKISCNTTHLLEWLNSGTPTTSNANKELEQQELSFTAGGNTKRRSFSEGQVGDADKINSLFPYNSAITILGIYSNELKTGSYKKPTHECLQQLYS